MMFYIELMSLNAQIGIVEAQSHDCNRILTKTRIEIRDITTNYTKFIGRLFI
jgi:hypothetical protein